MIKHFLIIIILALNAFSADVIAKETKIYRWTDNEGTLHFSHKAPNDFIYVELVITSSDSELSQAQSEQAKTQQPQSADALAASLQQKAHEYCEKAKQNVLLLRDNPTIKLQQDDGSTLVLNEDDKLTQQALAEKQITIFCPPAPTTDPKPEPKSESEPSTNNN